MKRRRKEDKCECARCMGNPNADPKWGFDRTKVPKVNCIVCKKSIGRRPYVLETWLARFGTMQFRHKAC